MENLLTLPAPLTARLADLNLLVFNLDLVLDRKFSNRRWILSLRNAREQVVLLPILQFMVLLGKNINANLHNLMLVAREHGLVFNLDKCVIKERMITFFEMLFDAERVHPYQEKVEAIRAIQVPQDAQELKSFLGTATYMAPFFPNLSTLSKPLSNLVKKSTNFYWPPSHSTAFEKIKQSICRQVSLTYFDLRKKILQVDISLSGLRSALVQEGKVVAFASRLVTDAEKRSANSEGEMPAVVACEKFHLYLFGKSQITNLLR